MGKCILAGHSDGASVYSGEFNLSGSFGSVTSPFIPKALLFTSSVGAGSGVCTVKNRQNAISYASDTKTVTGAFSDTTLSFSKNFSDSSTTIYYAVIG